MATKFYEIIEGSGGGREALYDAFNQEVLRNLQLEKEIKRLNEWIKWYQEFTNILLQQFRNFNNQTDKDGKHN